MKARQLTAMLAAGTLMVSVGSISTLGAPAFAHGQAHIKASVKARVRARARMVIRDRMAIVLAKALARSLKSHGRDVAILAMHPMMVGRAHGYLVTYLKGHLEGHLFVNTHTGKVRDYGRMVCVRVRANTSTPASGTSTPASSTTSTTSTQTTAGVTLSAFLSALETTLSTESGSPVSAVVEDGGAVTVFTVSMAGQDVTVSVDTNQAATTTTSTASQPTTFAGPTITMEQAVTTAMTDVGNLSIQTLSSPFVTNVELGGWDGFGPGTAPVYAVELESAAGGSAYVLVDGTSGSLLGIDTLGGAPGQEDNQDAFGLMAQAPSVTAVDAITTAMSQDSAGVPVAAELRQNNSLPVWAVDLANADGTMTQVDVNASTGAVVGLQTQGNDQGDQGDQGGFGLGGLFGIGGGQQGNGPVWNFPGQGHKDHKNHGDN